MDDPIPLETFRIIFDAVGDDTIDTTGGISGELLLDIIDAGPIGHEYDAARVRLVARWARGRGLRVGFHAVAAGQDQDR